MSDETPSLAARRKALHLGETVNPGERDRKREARYRKFASTWASISSARRTASPQRFDLMGRALQRAAEASPEARKKLLEVYHEAGAEEGRRMVAALPSGGDPAATIEAAAMLAGAEAEFTEPGPRRWAFRVRGLPPSDLVAGLGGETLLAATTAYLEGLLELLVPGLKPAFELSDRGELIVRLEKR